jgi:hypothetical protein
MTEPLSVEHVLAANPWADDDQLVAAAHDVASWVTSSNPPDRTTDTSSLLRSQLKRRGQVRDIQQHTNRRRRPVDPVEAEDARILAEMVAEQEGRPA